MTANSPRGPAFPAAIVWLIAAMAAPEAVGSDAPPGRPAAAIVARAGVEGVASPGLRIRLRGDGSSGDGLEFRWLQTWGPEAELDDPNAPNPTLIVPRAAGSLAFVLVVRNPDGVDMTTLRIPIRWEGRDPVPPELVADAGDDQSAIVGRQVTLNGIRSAPRDEIGYRWVQLDGPPVALALEDGYIYTFVPDRPGSYRFALLVASGNAISAPDEVVVDVRDGPDGLAPSGPLSSDDAPIESVASAALRAVTDGGAMGPALADVFEGVADRIDLYDAPAEAFREVALRLDAALPEGPEARERWNARVFQPVSEAMLAALAARGLDLSRAEVRDAPLSPRSRAILADQFRRVAAGFRSSDPSGRDGAAPATETGPSDRIAEVPEQGRGIR